jgi:hypothetical protein
MGCCTGALVRILSRGEPCSMGMRIGRRAVSGKSAAVKVKGTTKQGGAGGQGGNCWTIQFLLAIACRAR